MQKKLLWKLIAIGIVSILLLIPLSLIEFQIAARSARQDDVTRNIAESAAGSQTLVGPVILLRYRERIEKREKEAGTGRDQADRAGMPGHRSSRRRERSVTAASRRAGGSTIWRAISIASCNLVRSGHMGRRSLSP